MRAERRVALGVLLREAGELRLGARDVVAEDQVVAVLERAEQIGRGQHLEAEVAQLELADYLWM